MNETQLTITGNLVDAPEFRFTPGRAADREVPHRIDAHASPGPDNEMTDADPGAGSSRGAQRATH